MTSKTCKYSLGAFGFITRYNGPYLRAFKMPLRNHAPKKIPFAQNARFYAYLRGLKDAFCTECAFLRVITHTYLHAKHAFP